MNTVHRINNALAQILALLNVAAAVVVVLISAGAGYLWIGSFGFFAGALLGTAAAAVLCGFLALLINIRDLLAESLRQARLTGSEPFGRAGRDTFRPY